MGVTVHFEGGLKNEQAYKTLIISASVLASEMEWSITKIEKSEVLLIGVSTKTQ